MKLPEIGYKTGVPSLGTMPLQSATGMSTAVGALQSAVTPLLVESKRDNDKFQVQNASVQFTRHMTDWQISQQDKTTYHANEVPAGVDVRRTRKVIKNGEIHEELRDDIPAYEVFPQMYRKELENALEASSFNIEDARSRELWLNEQRTRGLDQYMKAQGASLQAQQTAIIQGQRHNIDAAIESGNIPLARQLIAESNIPDEEKPLIEIKAMRQYEMNLVNTAISTKNIANQEALRDIYSTPEGVKKSYLKPEQIKSVIESLNVSLSRDVASRDSFVAAQRAIYVTKAKEGIKGGTTTIKMVDDMLYAGMINPGEHTQMRAEILHYAQGALDQINMMAQINDEVQSGIYMTTDPKRRAAINTHFNEQLKTASPEQQKDLALAFMTKYRIVPEAVQQVWVGANKGPGLQVFEMAKQYRDALALAPHALRDIPEKSVDRIAMVAGMMGAGMATPGEILTNLAHIDAMTDSQKEAIKAESRTLANELTKGDLFNKTINNTFSADKNRWFFQFDPSSKKGTVEQDAPIPALMRQQVHDMTVFYLPQTRGNAAVAMQMAADKIKQRWTYTDVNGYREYMEWGPQGDTSIIREHLDRVYGPGARIASDVLTTTLVMNGQNPSYVVYRFNKDKGYPESLSPRWSYDPKAFEQEVGAARKKEAEAKRESYLGGGTVQINPLLEKQGEAIRAMRGAR